MTTFHNESGEMRTGEGGILTGECGKRWGGKGGAHLDVEAKVGVGGACRG